MPGFANSATSTLTIASSGEKTFVILVKLADKLISRLNFHGNNEKKQNSGCPVQQVMYIQTDINWLEHGPQTTQSKGKCPNYTDSEKKIDLRPEYTPKAAVTLSIIELLSSIIVEILAQLLWEIIVNNHLRPFGVIQQCRKTLNYCGFIKLNGT